MTVKPRNILIIVSDQLSAQALPAWGNTFASTPNIDRIIKRGVRFANAYTNFPLCQPSRASFWTGLYPHQTGVLSNGRKHHNPTVTEAVPTVGSVFSAAGYRTVHFGKQHDAGTLHGFESAPVVQAEITDADPAWPLNYDSKQDRNTCEQTVGFLKSFDEDAPYLAVADLNNPHDICNWIGEFQGKNELVRPGIPLPELPENLYRDEGEFEKLPMPVQYICCAHNRQAQLGEWDEEKIRHYLLAYHHYLTRVDTEIGRILSALEERNDADNTLIVFMADHGDSMCGRWMATKHTSFYNETTMIPFAFSGPGIASEGRSVDGPVSLIDLFPTLCDYAGLASPTGGSGCSLMPWLREMRADVPHDAVFSEWHTEWGFTIEPGRMVRTARYKYTHYLEGDGEELYDLENDPGEIRNLAGKPESAPILEEHRDLLKQHVAATDDPYFSLEWLADDRWRSHPPGYRNHRGIAAPQSEE